jgi:hypothetical protein
MGAPSPRRLFVASCMALVATAMSFAIRGDIMGDFERLFALTKTDIGWISDAAFWGFGLSILVAVVFTGMYLYDRVRGGYRVERIGEHTVV